MTESLKENHTQFLELNPATMYQDQVLQDTCSMLQAHICADSLSPVTPKALYLRRHLYIQFLMYYFFKIRFIYLY